MLKKLYQLQQLEAAAAAINTERINSDEYRQLRTLRTAFETDKKKLAVLKDAIARIENKIVAVDRRITDLETRINKEKQAIYDGSVTNSRELSARQGQLESLEYKLEIAVTEKSGHQEQLAKSRDDYGKLRQTLADMQSEFSRIRDIYQIRQEERDERSSRLNAEMKELISQIDAESLAWFEKQRNSFSGTPVAFLNRQCICSGCHTVVPMTTYRRVVQGQRVRCENCGRTLFVED